MAKPYSLDLRERVVAYVENGHSCKEASVVFDVSIASAVRWAARAKAEGSPAAMPMGGQRRDALAGVNGTFKLTQLSADRHFESDPPCLAA